MTDSTYDKEWDLIASATFESSNDPEGDVISDVDIWEYPDDPDDARFASRQDLSIFPGIQEYNSSWETDSANSWHDWSEYEPGPVSLVDHNPNKDKTGEWNTSFTVGYSGAAINWDYQQPDIEEYDDSTSDYGRWNWKWDPTGEGTPVLATGSEISSNYFPSSNDILTVMDTSTTFYSNEALDYYDVSIYQTFDY